MHRDHLCVGDPANHTRYLFPYQNSSKINLATNLLQIYLVTKIIISPFLNTDFQRGGGVQKKTPPRIQNINLNFQIRALVLYGDDHLGVRMLLSYPMDRSRNWRGLP